MDQEKIRSSITPDLLKRALFQGTSIATLGIVAMLLGAIFFPLNELKFWGLPLFIMGGGAITFGLLPYRKLCRLEMNPYEILVDDQHFKLVRRGKVQLCIPNEDIDNFKWNSSNTKYGITIVLKNKKELFLPYFTKRGTTALIAKYHEA